MYLTNSLVEPTGLGHGLGPHEEAPGPMIKAPAARAHAERHLACTACGGFTTQWMREQRCTSLSQKRAGPYLVSQASWNILGQNLGSTMGFIAGSVFLFLFAPNDTKQTNTASKHVRELRWRMHSYFKKCICCLFTKVSTPKQPMPRESPEEYPRGN